MRVCRVVAAGVGLGLAACAPRQASAPVGHKAPSAATATGDSDAWRDQEPAPGKATPLSYPAAEHATLDNGLALYVVRRPAGVVSLSFVVRHGASSTGRGKSGLAALVARMLTEGTRDRSSAELAEAVEDLGATLDHNAGYDFTSVGLTTLGTDTRRGLALLAEVALRPAFAPDVFDRVRREWLDQVREQRQDPAALAAIVGYRLLLGPVQGAPIDGSADDIQRLGVRDLVEFHRRFFVPGASALVVVGNVTLGEIQPQVAALFGTWRGPADPPPTPFVQTPAPERTRIAIVDRPGSVQSALFVAQPLPRRDAPGYEARELLADVLGGLFTSRINHNLREVHGYTYGAHTRHVATRLWGALVTTANVRTDVTGSALSELRGELAAARDPARGRPITDNELDRARADLASSLGAHLESVDGVGADVQELFVHGLADDYLARYRATVDGVDRATVQAQARARLLPDRSLVVIVGDRTRVEPGLQQLGARIEAAGRELTE